MLFHKTPDNGLALICVRVADFEPAGIDLAGSRLGGLFKPECQLVERTAL